MCKILMPFLEVQRNRQEYRKNQCYRACIVQRRYRTHVGISSRTIGYRHILPQRRMGKCRVVTAIARQRIEISATAAPCHYQAVCLHRYCQYFDSTLSSSAMSIEASTSITPLAVSATCHSRPCDCFMKCSATHLPSIASNGSKNPATLNMTIGL